MKTKSIINATDINKIIKHFKGGHLRRYVDQLKKDYKNLNGKDLTVEQVDNIRLFYMSLNHPQQFRLLTELVYMFGVTQTNNSPIYDRLLNNKEAVLDVEKKKIESETRTKRRLIWEYDKRKDISILKLGERIKFIKRSEEDKND